MFGNFARLNMLGIILCCILAMITAGTVSDMLVPQGGFANLAAYAIVVFPVLFGLEFLFGKMNFLIRKEDKSVSGK